MGTILKSIVITGASSGIGLSTSKIFINSGYTVFGSVRRNADATRLRNMLGDNFVPLNFDVNNVNEIKSAVSLVKSRIGNYNLRALINNAGIAVMGPIEHIKIEDFEKPLQTNVLGTLQCIKAFLPLLGTDDKNHGQKGRIINISSALGGRLGYPFYGSYCCSKHALEALSETLRRELGVYGIKVSIIAPGGIKTPIWDKSENDFSSNTLGSTQYSFAAKKIKSDMKKFALNGLTPETVAGKILKAVEVKQPKIRYTFLREFTLTLIYLTPTRLMDWAITKYLKLQKPKSD